MRHDDKTHTEKHKEFSVMNLHRALHFLKKQGNSLEVFARKLNYCCILPKDCGNEIVKKMCFEKD